MKEGHKYRLYLNHLSILKKEHNHNLKITIDFFCAGAMLNKIYLYSPSIDS